VKRDYNHYLVILRACLSFSLCWYGCHRHHALLTVMRSHHFILL